MRIGSCFGLLVVVVLAVRLAAQTPDVTGSGDASGLIGDTVTLTLTFDNTGSAPGYGAFINLILDAGGADLNGQNLPCDGISFEQAVTMNTTPPLPVGAIVIVAPCGGGSTTVQHPYPGVGPVTLPPGGVLIVLPVQVGSFQPTQAPITVKVTIRIHDYADNGHPLTATYRGGFRYGKNELDDWDKGDPPIVGGEKQTTITPIPVRCAKASTRTRPRPCPVRTSSTRSRSPSTSRRTTHSKARRSRTAHPRGRSSPTSR